MKLTLLISLITLLQLSCVAQATTTKPKLGENEKAGHYVNIGNFKMYYEVYGEGEPILFIHGNGGSMNAFENQVSTFAKKYRVIVADSRAQGKSIDNSDSLSYEQMAEDFNALLNHLKIDSSYVVGWSDGGINGLLLAMRHPEKVKKLIISGTNLWPDTTALDPWMYHGMMSWYDSLSKAPTTPEIKHQRKLVGLMTFQPHITTNDLKKVKCPTLVIGGDHDVILPRHTLLIAESISKSYLWIIPNAGHSTLISYKEDFNRVVMDFLKRPYKKFDGQMRLH